MINVKPFGSRLAKLNWKNGLFRLWLLSAVGWIIFVIINIIDGGVNLFILFALTWPIIILVFTVIFFKAGKWILLGLAERNDVTDSASKRIDHYISTETVINYGKKAHSFILPRSRQILVFTVSTAFLAFVILAIDFSLKISGYFPLKNPAISWRLLDSDKHKKEGKRIYDVETPDGMIVTLEGPDGASDDEILAAAQALYKPQPTPAAREQPAWMSAPIVDDTPAAAPQQPVDEFAAFPDAPMPQPPSGFILDKTAAPLGKFTDPKNLTQMKAVYLSLYNRHSVSLQAVILFVLGTTILFRRILLAKPVSFLVKVTAAYFVVIAGDYFLMFFSQNSLYSPMSLQILFLIVVAGYFLLKSFRMLMIKVYP